MARIAIEGERLVVTLSGLRALASMRRRIDVPLAAVTAARIDPTVSIGWRDRHERGPGRKLIGTNFYGFYLGGTFRRGEAREFWDVHRPERALVIELSEGRFARLVVEVADPGRTLLALEAARG